MELQFTRFSTNGQIYGFSLTIPIYLFILERKREKKDTANECE